MAYINKKEILFSANVHADASGTIEITENGTHDVSSYEQAEVNVTLSEDYIIPEGTKTITENGTHDVTEYASAEVNVPIPEGYVIPEGTVSITSNGTHDVSGKASAEVNVTPSLQSKTVTANGDVTADSGYDGLSKVTVSVPEIEQPQLYAPTTSIDGDTLTITDDSNGEHTNEYDIYVDGVIATTVTKG